MLKKFLSGLALSMLLGVVIASGLLLLHPTIPLGGLSRPVSWILSSITGFEQQVQGRFYLIPGRWTEFAAEEAAVTWYTGSGARLRADVTSCRVKLLLWPAIAGRFIFDVIEGGDVRLELTPGISQGNEDIEAAGSPFITIEPNLPVQANKIDLSNVTIDMKRPQPSPGVSVIHVVQASGSLVPTAAAQLDVIALFDDEAVTARIRASPLPALEETNHLWNFSAEVDYRSIRARLKGEVTGAGAARELVASVKISGDQINDLSGIVGSNHFSNLPFSVAGGVELSRGRLKTVVTEFTPGAKGLDFTLVARGKDFSTAQYEISLNSSLIDLDAVKALLSEPAMGADSRSGRTAGNQVGPDDLLFPDQIPAVDFRLALGIEKLVMAGRTIGDIRLGARMQNGLLEAAPFEATFTNLQGRGQFVIDLNREEPQVTIALETSEIDIGGMLNELGFLGDEQFLAIHLASSNTKIAASGRTLAEFRQNLHLEIEARDGVYRYQDPNTSTEVPIDLAHARLEFNAGKNLFLLLDGRVDEFPVDMALTIDDRRSLPWAGLDRLPLNFVLNTVGTTWELDGYVPIPLSLSGVTLESRLQGKKISDLNDLFGLVLPDIGPYELIGNFSRTARGYELEDLNLTVGASSLSGSVLVDTSISPPSLKLDLISPRIQLDDFKELRQSADQAKGVHVSAAAIDAAGENIGPEPAEEEENRRFLTDQEVLESYDASVRVEVAEVLSGQDSLGSGMLQIELVDGRLRLEPVVLNIPGGRIELDLLQEPAGPTRFYRVSIVIEDFDYGIIGRRIRPDTDVAGILNLRVLLEARSQDFDGIMEGSSGSLNLSVQPGRLRAGLVDLWAVNLLSYLFSFLAEESESKVNCLAGRFRLENGELTQEQLLIDTSRIQVKGSVEINFVDQTMYSYLRPIPKRPQFFSLATPIEIQGSFNSLGVRLPPSGIIGTIARVATSYIVVPIQWIILNKLPEDGTQDCLAIYRDWPDTESDEK